MRSVADQVNALGTFDAIIHNAAVVELGDAVCAAVLSRLHRSRAAENLESLSQKAGGILAPTVCLARNTRKASCMRIDPV
jgi:hypothetical protein